MGFEDGDVLGHLFHQLHGDLHRAQLSLINSACWLSSHHQPHQRWTKSHGHEEEYSGARI
jgi:hypothetical protein